jgi:anti-anti-sigma factor
MQTTTLGTDRLNISTGYRDGAEQGWSQLFCQVEEADDVSVVTLDMEVIDEGNARALGQALASCLNRGKRIVLDLGNARYFDAAGFGAIVGWLANARKAGVDVRLSSQARSMHALFELVKAQALVRLCWSKYEAIASFETWPVTDDCGVLAVQRPYLSATSGAHLATWASAE